MQGMRPVLRRCVRSNRLRPTRNEMCKSLRVTSPKAGFGRTNYCASGATHIPQACRASDRCADGSLLFAGAQRKVTKRKGPFPEGATARSSGVQEDFPTRHPASTENGAHPCAPPYRSCRWQRIADLSAAIARAATGGSSDAEPRAADHADAGYRSPTYNRNRSNAVARSAASGNTAGHSSARPAASS